MQARLPCLRRADAAVSRAMGCVGMPRVGVLCLFASNIVASGIFQSNVAAQLAGDELPTFDARLESPALKGRTPDAGARSESSRRISAYVPGAIVSFDDALGTPKFVRSTASYLTGPNPSGDWMAALEAFVNDYRELFGIDTSILTECRVTRDLVARGSGVRQVTLQQRINDSDVIGAELRASFTRRGELIGISSTLIDVPAKQDDAATVPVAGATVSAAGAVERGAANIGVELKSGLREVRAKKRDTTAFAEHSDLGGSAKASRAYFPLSRTEAVPVWVTEIPEPNTGNLYEIAVDAATGEVLHRWNRTSYAGTQPATYRIYTGDSPSPYSPGSEMPSSIQPPTVGRSLRTLVSLDSAASPNGWIDDGDNQTVGNNVDAHADRDGNNAADLPRPTGSPFRVFDFPLDLNQAPSAYTGASVVQLFYWSNLAHDRFYQLGFDEASGNFQTDNFGRGGVGGDALLAEAQDGAELNNAFFTSPPEGQSPRMEMFVFNGPTPDRDGGLDGEIVMHEYAHGVSNRLHGGLSALQSRGMGEGWSDFYALSLMSEPGDDPHGNYAMGAYASYQLSGLSQNYYFGIRRYPYSTRQDRNPLTFADIDPAQMGLPPGIPRSPVIASTANAVHNIGEVWCAMLWDCRANLIDTMGFEGNELMLRLVTDAMKFSPANPTFIEARDAILQADVANHGGAHLCELWMAFAGRGLGASAISPGASTTSGVIEAFDLPEDICASERGTVWFDRDVYACEATAQVGLSDRGLTGVGVVIVEASSANGDRELIALDESPLDSGRFVGTIAVTGEVGEVDDGALNVTDGTAISVVYEDADDGSGSGWTATAEAQIDCAAPTITDVTVTSVNAISAWVQFATDEAASVSVRFGPDCAALVQVADGATEVLHTVLLNGLEPETAYAFAIEAVDAAGNTAFEDNAGACFALTTSARADYFTEEFGDADNDLGEQRLVFTPDAASGGYYVCRETVDAFVKETGATRLFLGDDDYEEIDVPDGNRVWLYGQSYDAFYVSSNGFVTVGESDFDYSETLADHFARPRIAGLFDDLNPSVYGEISVKFHEDRALVTFDSVPEFGHIGANTFQIELYFDGRVAITHWTISAGDGIAGLSDGLGVPADFLESDLSAYGECCVTPSLELSPSPAAGTEGVATNAMLAWSNDGDEAQCGTVYTVRWGTSLESMTVICDGSAEAYCDPGALLPGTTYFWQVISADCCGVRESALFSFMTGDDAVCCRDGDINNDCRVTPGDALLAFQHYLHLVELEECQMQKGDVSESAMPAQLSPADSLCIFRYFLKDPASCMNGVSSGCVCPDNGM